MNQNPSDQEQTSEPEVSSDNSTTAKAVQTVPQSSNILVVVLLVLTIIAVMASFYIMNRRLVTLEQSLKTLETTVPGLPQATIDAIIALQSGQTGQQAAASDSTAGTGLVSIDDDAYVGDRTNARLALVEFSDFNCPYCGRFHSETLSQIMDKYVRTGEVLYVYRDFVGVGGSITLATAIAAECLRQEAGDQVYLDLVNVLYAATGRKTASMVSSFAVENGVDGAALSACIEENRFEQEVVADTRAGQAAGIRGTPGFVLGILQDDGTVQGVNIAGAQPFAYFDAVIQQQLAELN